MYHKELPTEGGLGQFALGPALLGTLFAQLPHAVGTPSYLFLAPLKSLGSPIAANAWNFIAISDSIPRSF